MKSYAELITIPDFRERYRYLRQGGAVGKETFGFDRYLNQQFYHTREWQSFRRDIIVRDGGLDLAWPGMDIAGHIFVHHINPITPEDLRFKHIEILLDPNNVICCSFATHNAIHYGDESMLPLFDLVERTPGDTVPWRN